MTQLLIMATTTCNWLILFNISLIIILINLFISIVVKNYSGLRKDMILLNKEGDTLRVIDYLKDKITYTIKKIRGLNKLESTNQSINHLNNTENENTAEKNQNFKLSSCTPEM